MEAALERLYRRLGPRRYVGVYSALASASVLALGLLALIAFDHYHPLSTSDALIALAVVAVTVGSGYTWGVRSTRRYWRPVLFWIERPGDADEARVWRSAIDLPRGIVHAIGLRLTLLAVPGTVLYLSLSLHLPVEEALVMFAGELLFIACGVLLHLFVAELVIRPMLAELADGLPATVTAGYQGLSLGRKLYAAIPFLVFAGSALALVLDHHRGAGLPAAGRDMAIAAVIAVVALVITIPVVESVRGPIRRLVPATRAVSRGDFEVRVPVTSTDELGVLMQSFNEMVVDLGAITEELRASRARVVAAADDERRRVERDLHDGAQQQLVLLGLKLGATERLLERDPAAGLAMFEELRSDLNLALSEMRELAHGIYPTILENDGLPGALSQAVERAAISAKLDCDGAGRYPREVESAVYFCCLEALQNAAKHAGDGARARIELAERDDRLVFAVADDGQGFDSTAAPATAGLQNMTDRIGALGGALSIRSAPGGGTTVTGAIPLGGME